MALRGRRLRTLVVVVVLMVPMALLWRGSPEEPAPQELYGDASSARDDDFSVRLGRGQREYVDTRGVHVVVGRYVGDVADTKTQPANLTEEELNANAFAPLAGEGRNGQPVILPPALQARARRLYGVHHYNLVAADRVPLNRTLPDVRRKKCVGKYSADGLPDASVIIVFRNEAWSTLLRTVQSVIDRSPRQLLREVILVDDDSNRAFLGAPLEEQAARLPVPTRVLRMERREGLVSARLLGARAAQGKVLVFLDAHCECTKGWLEPLLARVGEDRTRVVCPVIDLINEDTLAYVRSFDVHWGAFNWELHFRWYPPDAEVLRQRKADVSEPFRTPTMAGGLFAMDKDYFYEMGAYDDQMKIWGGENLETSFRVWMCGGSIEIAPCSHVGHIFRHTSPHSFPEGVADTLYSNLARVALVWMDDWKEFFFKFTPEAARLRDRQSVRARLTLRQRLQCKSFRWYLENVWPQHFFPTDDRFFGKIRNRRSGRCLYNPNAGNTASGTSVTGAAAAVPCLEPPVLQQMFVVAKNGAVMTDDSVCLDAPVRDDATRNPKARMSLCTETPRQRWRYDEQNKTLVHPASGMCLSQIDDGIVLDACSSDSAQQWLLDVVSWK